MARYYGESDGDHHDDSKPTAKMSNSGEANFMAGVGEVALCMQGICGLDVLLSLRV